MSQRLWLYRTKPRDDELFSSWLVRLAHGLAIKLQTFSVQLLGMPPGFWANDVDHNVNPAAVQILASATAVSAEIIAATGLSAYEGKLWVASRTHRLPQWIMPIVRFGRRRRGHGQQYCRKCLTEDEQPYFRRKWRIAFNVVCERHAIMLDDACRQCGSPVEFHAWDFGKRLMDVDCPITRCGTCGHDLRLETVAQDCSAPNELLMFQSLLNSMLNEGWSLALPGANIYSFLAFDGLRCIIRMLSSRGRSGRLRDLLLAQEGDLPLGVSTRRTKPVLEELRLGDRTRVMLWCAEIMNNWPDQFIRLCRDARISSNYIVQSRETTPYWLASVIGEYLYDRDYQPSQAEWVAAEAWLAKAGLPINTNATRRLLGLSCTQLRNRRSGSDLVKRWNPRGPRR